LKLIASMISPVNTLITPSGITTSPVGVNRNGGDAANTIAAFPKIAV